LKKLDVLVTGSKGQLGSELKFLTPQSFHRHTFTDLEEMDLTSEEAIRNFCKSRNIDAVVNCAGYTAVDHAEDNIELAYKINAEAVEILANICNEKKARLIHISTDYVFDGYGNAPLNETHPTSPLSVYGKSKLEGERKVLSMLPNCYVFRTAWLYSTFGKNFVKTIATQAKDRQSLRVVYDQIGTPTYARDLAKAVLGILDNIATGTSDVPGLYHYSNEGVTSWYDFACFIVDYYRFPCTIIPIRSSEYKTLATRPTFTVLDKQKLKSNLNLEVPHWQQSLRMCLSNLKL
jgi:dTDP-4-dehydrorhamnose reductase